MEILENKQVWLEHYQQNWLKKYQETGETDWKIYERPRNDEAPSGNGIDLADSKLLLISSAGAYLKESQQPYDAADDLGDYTMRTFPQSTPFEALAYSHDHYDHKHVDADPQVLLPLRHLEDMVAEGIIGALADEVLSLMGYLPNAAQLVDDLIPQLVAKAKQLGVRGALLVPA